MSYENYDWYMIINTIIFCYINLMYAIEYFASTNENFINKTMKYKIENYKEDTLRINLLQKLLPYNLDGYYLKNKKHFIKNDFGCILFTDIVSYCEISEKYTDIVIYLILDDIYSRFDMIIKKYPYIQKIETIGDAYMVVGDMNHLKDETNLYINMCNFALEIMEEIKKVKTPNHKLSLRIGIHVGPYIISVLGSMNPRLCIIGKHINKTARLQSTAQQNTIQISEELYLILSKLEMSNIEFTKNENIILKNIGSVNTYTMKKI